MRDSGQPSIRSVFPTQNLTRRCAGGPDRKRVDILVAQRVLQIERVNTAAMESESPPMRRR